MTDIIWRQGKLVEISNKELVIFLWNKFPSSASVRERSVPSYRIIKTTRFQTGEEEVEEESELEEVKVVEAPLVHIDREPYNARYKELMKDYPAIKLRNNFLQRKMAEYFKRRRVSIVPCLKPN